jgi:hypothetical protein|tara:strand:- start:100 stop:516 length:417 start_codon:yes stop_codon:yes gene_type:complete
MKFIIEPKQKKATYETEWYTNEGHPSTISVSTCWRWGRYLIEVDDIAELPTNLEDNPNGIVVSNYDWEMIDTMDGISVDITIDRADGMSATQEQQLDQLEADLEDTNNYYEYLENAEWIQEEVVVELFGPVTLELQDD